MSKISNPQNSIKYIICEINFKITYARCKKKSPCLFALQRYIISF